MEERYFNENPVSRRKRGKIRVASEEPIADIPVIRVVERIGFDVKTVVVPVAVDRPQNALHTYAVPSITPVLATTP